jgi:hypothetical protein
MNGLMGFRHTQARGDFGTLSRLIGEEHQVEFQYFRDVRYLKRGNKITSKKFTIGGKSFEFNIEYVNAIIEHMDGIQKCEDMKAEFKALANTAKVEMK